MQDIIMACNCDCESCRQFYVCLMMGVACFQCYPLSWWIDTKYSCCVVLSSVCLESISLTVYIETWDQVPVVGIDWWLHNDLLFILPSRMLWELHAVGSCLGIKMKLGHSCCQQIYGHILKNGRCIANANSHIEISVWLFTSWIQQSQSWLMT